MHVTLTRHAADIRRRVVAGASRQEAIEDSTEPLTRADIEAAETVGRWDARVTWLFYAAVVAALVAAVFAVTRL